MAKGATSKRKREDENRQTQQRQEETRQRQQRTQRETANSRQTTRQREAAPQAIPVLEEPSTPRRSATGRNISQMFPEYEAPQATTIPAVEPIQTNKEGQGFRSDIEQRMSDYYNYGKPLASEDQGIRSDAEERIKASDASLYGSERAEDTKMEEYPSADEKGRKDAQRRSETGAKSASKNEDELISNYGERREARPLSEEAQSEVNKLQRRLDRVSQFSDSQNQNRARSLQNQINAIIEADGVDDATNIERYLDSDYRMSRYEQKDAERIFDEYLENNPKAKELYSTNDAAMSSLLAQRMSPEEANEYSKMVALKNKTNDLSSAGLHMVESMPFVKSLADKSAKAYDEMKGTDTSEYNYSNQLEQTQKQNPLASIGGNMAYQLGQYAAFAPLIEEIPVVGKVATGIGSKFKNPAVAKAVESIVSGQAADTLLDTLPNAILPDIMEGNWRDLPKDIALNEAGNFAFNVLGEGAGALAKNFIPSLKNADEAVDAVKQSEIEAKISPTDDVPEGMITKNANQLTDDLSIAERQIERGMEGVKPFDNIYEKDARIKLNERGKLSQIIEGNPQIQRHYDGPIKSEDEILADIESVYKQMDDRSHGKMRENDKFDFGLTPGILKEHGIIGNRLMMDQSILDKITLPKGYLGDKGHNHGYGREGIEKIIRGLNDPAVIMISRDGDDIETVLNLASRHGTPMWTPITIGKDGVVNGVSDIANSANIKSSYFRGGLDTLLEKNTDRIRYIKGEDETLSNVLKNNALESSSPSTPNINQIDNSVKRAIQPEPIKTEIEKEAEAYFSNMGEGYDGSRDWWRNLYKRVDEFVNGGDPAETAARTDIANRYLANMEASVRESQALIDAGGTPTWSMPSPTKQLDDVAARINSVLDNVSLEDEKLALEAANIRKAIDNYRTALSGDSLDAVTQARKDLTNAAKRFDTRAKKIDLDGYDGTFGNRSFTYSLAESTGVGSPETLWKNIADADERNRMLLSGEEQEDTLGKLLNGETLEETTKATPAMETPKAEPIPTEAVKNTPDVDEPIDLTRGPSGSLKERGTSEHIKSIEDVRVATPMKMEGVSDEVVADFVDNPDMYKVLKNADTKALADDIYNSGDQAVRIGDKVYTGDIDTKFGKLLSEKNPAALPLGHQLAKDYSAAGNHDMAAQIYRRMGEELTKAGQFSQAAAINMMKDDPLTALQYAERQLDAINQQGLKRFRDRWVDLSLTDDEIKAFNDIQPGDSKAIKALYDKIGARLGKEYPTTFMEKLLEGRKVAMLFNVRTNVRNLGANAPTLGMRWVSDRVDALGQNIAHIINPDFKVTQAGFGSGREGRRLAKQVYESDIVQALLNNDTGKYEIPELSNALMKDRQVFKGTALSKWINKVTDGGIEELNKELFGKEGVESTLETIRNATYKALELGDTPFVKENFIERLGSYIHAQGIKDIKDVPDEAIQIAWEEAMKATYKDNSWAVQMLKGFKNGMEKVPIIGKPLSQASIPFVQAPGNIAARMVDYSPIRGIKGIGDIISGAKKNNEQAVRRGIEEVSKGITGTGMVILGMKLKKAGILTGDYSKDKDQKNFEKQNGFKPWALHVGNKYFTYDWAQPYAQPMIVGTLLQEAIDKSDEYDSTILNSLGIYDSKAGDIIGAAKAGAKASINSWFDASPLQGMADLLKSDYSGETDVAQNVFDTAISDFAGAFIPSIVNATAKTIDPVQRNTVDPSNPLKSFINAQQAKLPGVSAYLPAKYDTWGEQMNYADNSGEAFLQRFLIPGDYATESDDPIDIEINNLFDSTGDNGVFPLTAPNKVGDRKLNNREVSDYQQDMGQRSRQLAEAFINSDLYQELDNDTKASTLKKIYSISKAITERDLFGKQADNDFTNYLNAYDSGDIDGLFNAVQANAIVGLSGVSSTSKAADVITNKAMDGDIDGAMQLANALPYLAYNGLPTAAQGTYAERSVDYLGNIDPVEYSNTWNTINGGPDGNDKVSQDELIAYFDEHGIKDQREMLEYWGGYLDSFDPEENKVPYIKEDGTIGKHKATDDEKALIQQIISDNSQAGYGTSDMELPDRNQAKYSFKRGFNENTPTSTLPTSSFGQGFSQNIGQPSSAETAQEVANPNTSSGDVLEDAINNRRDQGANAITTLEPQYQPGNNANPVEYITSAGLNLYSPEASWNKAYAANANLTPQEFVNTWSAVDADSNGRLKKSEFVKYLNSMGYTPEEAELFLAMYYPSSNNALNYRDNKWYE